MKKSPEERALEFVKSKGGEIKKIIKQNDKNYYHIICKRGHPFKKERRKLLYDKKQYCNYYPCSKGRKSNWKDKLGFGLFISRLKEIFNDDVICIEKTPLKSRKFLFKCNKCGHEWSNDPSKQITTPIRKKRPSSCKECGGSSPTSEKEKREYLKELNIKEMDGLSKIENQQTNFFYQCIECLFVGNKTLNQLLQLKKNELGYCDCNYKRTHWTSGKLLKYAKSEGYKLISKPNKINTNDKYEWECLEKGHITSFSIGSLKNGCFRCFQDKRFTKLNDIENWLNDQAPYITLLPNQVWKGSHYDYDYKCNICTGEFSKHLHNLIKFPKCKNQSRSYSELLVQFYLEELLGIKFENNKKNLPFKLENRKGNKMELDGYNKKNKIAFEHHGIQHYKNYIYHDNENSLETRKRDDELKRRQCKKNGIKLIEIPALFDILEVKCLKEKIKDELERLEIKIPDNFDEINPNRSEMKIYHKKKK